MVTELHRLEEKTICLCLGSEHPLCLIRTHAVPLSGNDGLQHQWGAIRHPTPAHSLVLCLYGDLRVLLSSSMLRDPSAVTAPSPGHTGALQTLQKPCRSQPRTFEQCEKCKRLSFNHFVLWRYSSDSHQKGSSRQSNGKIESSPSQRKLNLA